MTALVTPFALIWLGVVNNMPLGYYALVSVPLLFDVMIGIAKGVRDESD